MKNEFKNFFDFRLKVLRIVDIFYGGEAGFKEVVRYFVDNFAEINFIREKKILENFFLKLVNFSGVCYGVKNVVVVFESGVLEILIIYEDFDEICEKKRVVFDRNFFWFVDKFVRFKIKVEIITGISGECA